MGEVHTRLNAGYEPGMFCEVCKTPKARCPDREIVGLFMRPKHWKENLPQSKVVVHVCLDCRDSAAAGKLAMNRIQAYIDGVVSMRCARETAIRDAQASELAPTQLHDVAANLRAHRLDRAELDRKLGEIDVQSSDVVTSRSKPSRSGKLTREELLADIEAFDGVLAAADRLNGDVIGHATRLAS